MAEAINLSRLNTLWTKWRWLIGGAALVFLWSTGTRFQWGGDRLQAQIDSTRVYRKESAEKDIKLAARLDTLEAQILPALNFLIIRECMDPRLPQELYTFNNCSVRLARHDLAARPR